MSDVVPVVGFTGTRSGMRRAQRITVDLLLRDMRVERFHHGDCVGADAEAHALAMARELYIVLHPPTNPTKRAFCKGARETRDPLSYLARDRAIVAETSLLIAAPRDDSDPGDGGTWYTINYALGASRRVIVVWPNGGCEERKGLAMLTYEVAIERAAQMARRYSRGQVVVEDTRERQGVTERYMIAPKGHKHAAWVREVAKISKAGEIERL